MQAHPHTSCHPLRHENLPATRSSSKLPASTHVVLTESRASDQEEESAFGSDRRSGVACSPALTRPHLLLTHKFGVPSLLRHHLLSTHEFGVLAAIRQTNALSLSFRLPRSEASVVHPFRPSFHVPSSPSLQRTDARARGSLLVIAISGSMRLHSLVTAI